MSQDFQKTTEQFFSDLLGFEPELNIIDSDEETNIHLQLEQQNSGILIGYRGETLASIQLILSLIYQKQAGSWKPVRLNINDYREKRQQSLQVAATNAAAKAVADNQPVHLTGLTSYERRIVHSYLNDDPSVETESQGDAPNRTLIISPAPKK